ncbi:hypothetical protein [Anatilimnocola floriformis]|uniref:hypothetical protein n=1 Tax=Anatilimnocola floriformis TaxID=2948575 RepID=UPI0020C201E5|nr:hypothetical protein [Anatilimnocola floriformis]
MKLRSVVIVTLVSFVMLGMVVAVSWGQFGSQPSNPTQNMELINDLHLRKTPADDTGRFRIVSLPGNTMLLDSKTGDTWVLKASAQAKLRWVVVPRSADEEEQEEENVKPAKLQKDPFE